MPFAGQGRGWPRIDLSCGRQRWRQDRRLKPHVPSFVREMNELASAVANVPALPSGTGRLAEVPDNLHTQMGQDVVTSSPQPHQKPDQLVVLSGALESSVVASQGPRTETCANKKAATNGGLLSTSALAVTGIPKRAQWSSNPATTGSTVLHCGFSSPAIAEPYIRHHQRPDQKPDRRRIRHNLPANRATTI